MKWLPLLLVAGCSGSPNQCPGASPAQTLFESYCQHGEAARCYFTDKPMDGF